MSRRRRTAPPDADVGGVPNRVYDGPVLRMGCQPGFITWRRPPTPQQWDSAFADSLLQNGFALVENTAPVDDFMKSASDRRFALSAATKSAMSVSAEDGYVKGEHKEIFYFGPRSANCFQSRGQRPWIGSAVRMHRNAKLAFGERLVSSLNRKVFKPPGSRGLEDDRFLDTWYDEQAPSLNSGCRTEFKRRYCCALDHSVISDFSYLASCPDEFHSNAHVDKGLLTIIDNPADVEVCVNGEWMVPYDPALHAGAALVLVGYTLERASGGHFHASLHRVRNRGARRSTVTKLHTPPDLVIEPALLCSHLEVNTEEMSSFTSRRLLADFRRNHASVNAPASAASGASAPQAPLAPQNPTPQAQQRQRRGADARGGRVLRSHSARERTHERTSNPWADLAGDTIELILRAATVQTLGRLASTCTMLCDCVAAADGTVWVPAAERSRIDWNLALDRIDLGAPSYGRARARDIDPQDAAALLTRFDGLWPEILRRELTDDEMHATTRISSKVVAQDGSEIFFVHMFRTPMQKVMQAFCNRQGVSMGSVRFLFDGQRINPNQTAVDLEMYDSDVIDVMVEQQGD